VSSIQTVQGWLPINNGIKSALPAFVGRYEIRGEIDRGSFAIVALAWDEELESQVALKILDSADSQTEKRFLNEARMLRRVRAPNVITVHDTGRLNDGRPYFVLNYADRGTLADRVSTPLNIMQDCYNASQKSGESSAMQASTAIQKDSALQSLLFLVDAIADGLAAIHAAGLIHRDIKPANILFESVRRATGGNLKALSNSNDPKSSRFSATAAHALLVASDERVLVGDLGIAKDLTASHDHPTVLGGTPHYLAPEQLDAAASITAATDIYAASAVLWKVLTGRQPPLPDQLASQLSLLPDFWQHIVEQGMARNPDERFQSMDEWRWAIHEVVGHGDSTAVFEPVTRTDATAECPYKGLAAYQPDDACYFSGREAMTDELLRRLQLDQVLVVGGPSGSGKSSLVGAGLVPALKAGGLPGSENWAVDLITPGRDPMLAIAQCVENSPESRNEYDPDVSDTVHSENLRLVVVDQFEEVFTLCTDAQREEYLSALAALADCAQSRVKIVIVVRADFYGECAKEPWLAGRISNNQVLVGPMTPQELRRAISEPARKAGYFLERGLIETILEQAGSEAGSLPLVAHSLVETWVRRNGNTLTLEGFAAAGGLAGAISQTADATYDHQLDDEGREATRQLMLRLVAPGSGTPDTRRILPRSELGAESSNQTVDRVVELLTEARLLTVDSGNIQIAHEALLQRWPRLRRWIDESRDELRIREKITHAADEWASEGQEADLLYRGTPLLSALEWDNRNPGQLGLLEHKFLESSKHQKQAVEQAEQQKLKRSKKARRIAFVVLSLLSIGATVATFVAYIAYRDSRLNASRAEHATEEAEMRFAGALGAAAFGHVEEDPRLSLVLSAESMAFSPASQSSFDTRAAMVSARQHLAKGGPFLLGSPLVAGQALSIALNPQGSILAIGTVDGVINLVDTASRAPIQKGVQDHVGGIRDIAFHPEGHMMVSAGTDGTLRLWQPDQKGVWASTELAVTRDVVPDVDFHPNGKSVFSANDEGTVQQWFIDGRTDNPPPLTSENFGFNALAISPDGQYVLTANADKTISGWSLKTGQRVMGPLSAAGGSHLVHLEFNSSGDRIVTVSTDGEARLLEFPSGKDRGQLFDPNIPVGIAFFLIEKDLLVAGEESGRLTLWNPDENSLHRSSARGHTQTVIDRAISRDGRLLATLGRDQLIRFWTLGDDYPLAASWSVEVGKAKGVSISADGSRIAAGDENGGVQVWRLNSTDSPVSFRGHSQQVWAIAFSPNGELLATGDRQGKIRLWNSHNGRVLRELDTGMGAAWSLVFSDNNTLLVASENGISRWQVSDGKLIDKIPESENTLTRMAVSPDHLLAVTSLSSGLIRVWELASGKLLRTIAADDDVIWSVAFSPDGQTLAAASGSESVLLFSVLDGALITRLTGHAGGATNVGFLADGATLVATDRQGGVHWWDLHTSRRLAAPWAGHGKSIWRMSVHPDGTQVATSGDDGKVSLWNVLNVRRACDIGYPSFDSRRRKQYFGNERNLSACEPEKQ